MKKMTITRTSDSDYEMANVVVKENAKTTFKRFYLTNLGSYIGYYLIIRKVTKLRKLQWQFTWRENTNE